MRDGRSRPAMMALALIRFVLVTPFCVFNLWTGLENPYNYNVLRYASIIFHIQMGVNIRCILFIIYRQCQVEYRSIHYLVIVLELCCYYFIEG